MANQFTISLIWVPGHRDIVGNCIADELARQGTTKPLRPGEENVGMPMATCKLNIKKLILLTSQHPLAKRTTVSYLSPYITCDKQQKKTSELLKLSLTECGMLDQALTGSYMI